MGYVEANLLPDEKVVHRAKLHWLIFSKALLVVMAGILAAWFEQTVGTVVVLVGLAMCLPPLIAYKTSEFAVTTRRVIIKVGLIRRRTVELLLRQVEAISVDQSILGRMFNYGSITLSGTGGVREVFDDISRPLEFRRQVQSQTM